MQEPKAKDQKYYNVTLNRSKSFSAYFPLFSEFFRYILVGGSAFLLDMGILYITKTYLFSGLGLFDILLATACGFTAGLIYNYILSFVFVFKKINKDAKQHRMRSFIIFTVIGVIGLGLTEVLMYGGILLVGEQYYLLVKAVTAGIVLLWNYAARKILIFKGV
jgi:putative flippase GtrA